MYVRKTFLRFNFFEILGRTMTTPMTDEKSSEEAVEKPTDVKEESSGDKTTEESLKLEQTAENAAKPPATTAKPPATSAKAPVLSAERARVEVGRWIGSGKLSKVDSDALAVVLKEDDGLKEKVGKLKSLLGRSAKAQRESKVELDATQKRLDQALKEIERLNRKVDKLANRPTHMELLADFESNFDRALLQVGQPGGEDTGPPTSSAALNGEDDAAVVDNLLMQELAESKQRIDKLESLNAALVHRSSQLEGDAQERKQERDELAKRVAHLELEKRMAVMEADHATKALEEKAASLAEMQMEIELVTKASATANKRAAMGEEMAKSVKTDKHHVEQLEAQVVALREWALASAETKTLAQERVRLLESQLQALQSGNKEVQAGLESAEERVIWTKKAAMIVGAGDVGSYVAELDKDIARKIRMSERLVLRWQFDLSGEDLDIIFSIARGKCEAKSGAKQSDPLLSQRRVLGGAAGEVEHAFNVDYSCTLLWSNVKSWIRPKTVKYTLSAVVLAD